MSCVQVENKKESFDSLLKSLSTNNSIKMTQSNVSVMKKIKMKPLFLVEPRPMNNAFEELCEGV